MAKQIKFENMIPEVYSNESRDFQVLCRAFDCMFNGVKFDIDAVLRIIDTASINNVLLPLLQTKLGFFSNYPFTDEQLREILKAFPRIVKYKGTRKAIEEAINLYLRINKLNTKYNIELISKNEVGVYDDGWGDNNQLTSFINYYTTPNVKEYREVATLIDKNGKQNTEDNYILSVQQAKTSNKHIEFGEYNASILSDEYTFINPFKTQYIDTFSQVLNNPGSAISERQIRLKYVGTGNAGQYKSNNKSFPYWESYVNVGTNVSPKWEQLHSNENYFVKNLSDIDITKKRNVSINNPNPKSVRIDNNSFYINKANYLSKFNSSEENRNKLLGKVTLNNVSGVYSLHNGDNYYINSSGRSLSYSDSGINNLIRSMKLKSGSGQAFSNIDFESEDIQTLHLTTTVDSSQSIYTYELKSNVDMSEGTGILLTGVNDVISADEMEQAFGFSHHDFINISGEYTITIQFHLVSDVSYIFDSIENTNIYEYDKQEQMCSPLLITDLAVDTNTERLKYYINRGNSQEKLKTNILWFIYDKYPQLFIDNPFTIKTIYLIGVKDSNYTYKWNLYNEISDTAVPLLQQPIQSYEIQSSLGIQFAFADYGNTISTGCRFTFTFYADTSTVNNYLNTSSSFDWTYKLDVDGATQGVWQSRVGDNDKYCVANTWRKVSYSYRIDDIPQGVGFQEGDHISFSPGTSGRLGIDIFKELLSEQKWIQQENLSLKLNLREAPNGYNYWELTQSTGIENEDIVLWTGTNWKYTSSTYTAENELVNSTGIGVYDAQGILLNLKDSRSIQDFSITIFVDSTTSEGGDGTPENPYNFGAFFVDKPLFEQGSHFKIKLTPYGDYQNKWNIIFANGDMLADINPYNDYGITVPQIIDQAYTLNIITTEMSYIINGDGTSEFDNLLRSNFSQGSNRQYFKFVNIGYVNSEQTYELHRKNTVSGTYVKCATYTYQDLFNNYDCRWTDKIFDTKGNEYEFGLVSLQNDVIGDVVDTIISNNITEYACTPIINLNKTNTLNKFNYICDLYRDIKFTPNGWQLNDLVLPDTIINNIEYTYEKDNKIYTDQYLTPKVNDSFNLSIELNITNSDIVNNLLLGDDKSNIINEKLFKNFLIDNKLLNIDKNDFTINISRNNLTKEHYITKNQRNIPIPTTIESKIKDYYYKQDYADEGLPMPIHYKYDSNILLPYLYEGIHPLVDSTTCDSQSLRLYKTREYAISIQEYNNLPTVSNPPIQMIITDMFKFYKFLVSKGIDVSDTNTPITLSRVMDSPLLYPKIVRQWVIKQGGRQIYITFNINPEKQLYDDTSIMVVDNMNQEVQLNNDAYIGAILKITNLQSYVLYGNNVSKYYRTQDELYSETSIQIMRNTDNKEAKLPINSYLDSDIVIFPSCLNNIGIKSSLSGKFNVSCDVLKNLSLQLTTNNTKFQIPYYWFNLDNTGVTRENLNYLNPYTSSTEYEYFSNESNYSKPYWFTYRRYIDSIRLPTRGITSIPGYTYSDTNIESVYVSKNINYISQLAFYNCQKLNKICYELGEDNWNAVVNIGDEHTDIYLQLLTQPEDWLDSPFPQNKYYRRTGDGTAQSPYIYTILSQSESWDQNTYFIREHCIYNIISSDEAPDDWGFPQNKYYLKEDNNFIPITILPPTFEQGIYYKKINESSYVVLTEEPFDWRNLPPNKYYTIGNNGIIQNVVSKTENTYSKNVYYTKDSNMYVKLKDQPEDWIYGSFPQNRYYVYNSDSHKYVLQKTYTIWKEDTFYIKPKIEYNIKNKNSYDLYDYFIKIKINSQPYDTQILDELFKYLLPTGFTYEISFDDV